eukprot:15445263-Alexandrium_andersonii.AAC.1
MVCAVLEPVAVVRCRAMLTLITPFLIAATLIVDSRSEHALVGCLARTLFGCSVAVAASAATAKTTRSAPPAAAAAAG